MQMHLCLLHTHARAHARSRIAGHHGDIALLGTIPRTPIATDATESASDTWSGPTSSEHSADEGSNLQHASFLQDNDSCLNSYAGCRAPLGASSAPEITQYIDSAGKGLDSFELVVKTNFTYPDEPETDRLQMVPIANNLPFMLGGVFPCNLPEGVEVAIGLQYVLVHDMVMRSGTTQISWILEDLGAVEMDRSSEAAFEKVIPARRLRSSWNEIADRKKLGKRNNQHFAGTFRTYLRAEVVCRDAGRTRSFLVYSPEVHVCTDRNLRRMLQLQLQRKS